MRTNIAPWDYALLPRISRPNYRCPSCGGAATKTCVVNEMLVICLKRRPCATVVLDAQAVQTLVEDYNYQHDGAPSPLDDWLDESNAALYDQVAEARLCARFGFQL